jgi:hypothetical protein
MHILHARTHPGSRDSRRTPAQQVLRRRGMTLLALVAVFALDVKAPASQEPPPAPTRPVGTMSDLMIKMIYPTSDAIFYIETRTPKTDAEWGELQAMTLTLAESANLLMMPGRARDQERWMADAKLMLDAGMAAYAAAKKKDVAALVELNDAVYQSCVVCHQHYRRNYGRRP